MYLYLVPRENTTGLSNCNSPSGTATIPHPTSITPAATTPVTWWPCPSSLLSPSVHVKVVIREDNVDILVWVFATAPL